VDVRPVYALFDSVHTIDHSSPCRREIFQCLSNGPELVMYRFRRAYVRSSRWLSYFDVVLVTMTWDIGRSRNCSAKSENQMRAQLIQ
jgi:hypothetical protein